MRRLPLRALTLATLWIALAPGQADAEDWDPAEVEAAERLRAQETARAGAYRERVARGELRPEAAPSARRAPEPLPFEPGSAGEVLRGAADFADWIERWLGERRAPSRPRSAAPPSRREHDPADDWWAEEERRLGEGR